jgi:multidrug efflux pump subunit AcrA (membrane-fusion protein)
MDKLIDPSVRRKRILRRVVISIAIVVCAWAALASSLSWLWPAIKQSTLRTARVERGTIEVGFDAGGTVVPASERALSSPIDARLLRVLQRAGSVVRAGDPLLELDTSLSRLALEGLTDRIVQNQSQRQQLESQRDQALDALEAQLEQRRLDLEILRYRDQQNQRLHSEGLVAEEAARESAVSAKKAEIELQQLERSIESTARSSAAQIASVDAELRTLRNEKEQAVRQLELAQTRADRDGVLTWIVACSCSSRSKRSLHSGTARLGSRTGRGPTSMRNTTSR